MGITNEEAINSLNTLRESINGVFDYNCRKQCIALDMAIQALKQQPREDCISREEAIRVAEQGQIQGYEWQFKKLCTLPSVTPQPKIRYWIDRFGGCECSECGCLEAGYSDYCPNCGAKMEVEE